MGLKVFPWEMGSAGHEAIEEEVRGSMATLVGGQAQDVALCPSTSYSVSLVSRSIPLSGRRNCVLVTANQMASNVMPWQRAATEAGGRLIVIPRPADWDWG